MQNMAQQEIRRTKTVQSQSDWTIDLLITE